MPRFRVIIFRVDPKDKGDGRIRAIEELHEENREAPNMNHARDRVLRDWEASHPNVAGPRFVYGASER
jgi:hypothetical protein